MSTFAEVEQEIIAHVRKNPEAVIIELGCGQQKLPEGFIGADLYPHNDQVIKADLFSTPWPWADESVDMFSSAHFLEHVPDWNAHFAEVYRCLKPGGFYKAVVPYGKSNRFLQDPTHKQQIVEERLWYLHQGWRRDKSLDHGYLASVNFSQAALAFAYNDDYVDKSDEAQEWARSHYWNVVDDLAFVLKKEPL